MSDRTLRLTVSAAADRSLTAVVQPLLDAFSRAKGKVVADTKAMGDGMKRAAKEGVDPLGKSFDQAAARGQKAFKQIEEASAKAAVRQAADAERASQARVRADQRAWDAQLKSNQKAISDRKRVEAEFERSLARELAAHERAEARKSNAAGRADDRRAARLGSFGANTITGAASNVMSLGRSALGFAGSVAGGLGANFDVGNMIGRSVGLQSMATQISNSAFTEGGKRESAADLVGMARKVGDDTASDPTKVLEGLSAYQGKTGDLDTIKAGMVDLSRLAKASYTDLGQMIDAAGDVGNALGNAFESPEAKAQAIGRVMRVIAAQGQVGAVEIKDLAVQMAKLSAASTSFEGSGEKNLEMMGALAQFARAKGGAATATAAATSVAGFVNTLKTPARQNKFKEAGIDVYSATERGMLKNPFELITEALNKTAMNPTKFKELFANVVGAKPAEALATVYRQAEAKKEGTGNEAVQKMMADYMKPMGEGKVKEDFAAAMATTASKAQLFQNQLERIASSMAEKLLPAAERLAPKFIELADDLATAISWISNNLGPAIGIAIGASIAKAGLSAALPKMLESVLSSAMKGNLGGGVAFGGGAGGALAAAGAIGAIAMATFTIGKAIIDVLSEDTSKGKDKGMNNLIEMLNADSEAKAAMRAEEAGKKKREEGEKKKAAGDAGGDAMIMAGDAMIAEAKKNQAIARGHLKAAVEKQSDAVDAAANPTGILEAAMPFSGKSFKDRAEEQTTNENMPEISASLKEMTTTLNRLNAHLDTTKKNGPQEVHVTNMPAGPLVNPDGVVGIPPGS